MSVEIVLPIIHLNGSSKDFLMESLREAAIKVQEAEEALAKTAPNQRDYYCAPDADRWKRALAQHQRRMTLLADLYAELTVQWEALADLP